MTARDCVFVAIAALVTNSCGGATLPRSPDKIAELEQAVAGLSAVAELIRGDRKAMEAEIFRQETLLYERISLVEDRRDDIRSTLKQVVATKAYFVEQAQSIAGLQLLDAQISGLQLEASKSDLEIARMKEAIQSFDCAKMRSYSAALTEIAPKETSVREKLESAIAARDQRDSGIDQTSADSRIAAAQTSFNLAITERIMIEVENQIVRERIGEAAVCERVSGPSVDNEAPELSSADLKRG